ncbi:MAG: hypothetical protein GC160_13195 [Acidobacteria bacterium]|nr:hypothetical protein [Acidobacteriota bacterium]
MRVGGVQGKLDRVLTGAAVLLVLGGVLAVGQVSRTPPQENKAFEPGEPVEQPLPYSHKLHVGLGLKCRDCHTIPDPGDFATYPAEAKCTACHAAIKTDSPHIQKLLAAEKAGEPIAWNRVYQLPEYVYFSHAVHVIDAKVECSACHGDVASRDVLFQEKPISMYSCMGCHTKYDAPNDCELCHDTH